MNGVEAIVELQGRPGRILQTSSCCQPCFTGIGGKIVDVVCRSGGSTDPSAYETLMNIEKIVLDTKNDVCPGTALSILVPR